MIMFSCNACGFQVTILVKTDIIKSFSAVQPAVLWRKLVNSLATAQTRRTPNAVNHVWRPSTILQSAPAQDAKNPTLWLFHTACIKCFVMLMGGDSMFFSSPQKRLTVFSATFQPSSVSLIILFGVSSIQSFIIITNFEPTINSEQLRSQLEAKVSGTASLGMTLFPVSFMLACETLSIAWQHVFIPFDTFI